MTVHRLTVLVDTPQHSGVPPLLDYLADRPVAPGTLVRVPLGARETLGIAWDAPPPTDDDPPDVALRPVGEVLDAVPPLDAGWRALVDFAAGYYQRSPGELALAALPAELKALDAARLAARVARLPRRLAAWRGEAAAQAAPAAEPTPEPTPEQEAAWQALQAATAAPRPAPVLLHGVTGSGKTEVYLRAAAQALQAGGQALLLVPEINLTPQLESRVRARFPGRCVVSLHSGLTPALRLAAWLAVVTGAADLVLGTRLAIFAPLQRLALIVVDEEHDPSYKQQEGARYSARDLAVWRAHALGVPVLLGSATPSLESWHRAEQGRYLRLTMARRVGDGAMPRLRSVDLRQMPRARGEPPPPLAAPLVQAIGERLERGEQSLLLLNRRGYAPVLHCTACGWKSACPHCSAWRVFHKLDRTLRCHHCGESQRVPRACPDCGNLDIHPLGRGTERLQEQVAALWPQARVARIDADSTRLAGALQAELQRVHDGEVDILVGTQMLAKGHDFRRVTLVAAVDPDGALFASDFRASERLFALLLQAAGRAGRDATQAGVAEMWLQTWHPEHPVYAALARHDFVAFAKRLLDERHSAGLPPFAHLALLRAEARTVEAATAFLDDARQAARVLGGEVLCYAPVPPAIARVANVERLQLLVESPSRGALQAFLGQWMLQLHGLKRTHRAVLRWAVDVDPLAI